MNLRTTSIVLIAASLIVVPVAAVGADEASSTVIGAGNVSCGTYALARQEGNAANKAAISSWIHGYLTGMNELTENITGQPENIIGYTPATAATVEGDLWTFFDNYCAENPLDVLHDAASALTNALWTRQSIVLSPG